MPISSVEFVWALIVFIGAMIFLACTVIATILIHSARTREAERKFRMLFEKVFDPLILINEECNIIDVNEATCKMFGYVKDELLGSSLKKLMANEEWSKIKNDCIKSIKSGLDYFGETSLVNKDGKVVIAEAGGTGLRINGGIYLLTSFRDIGSHKQAQEELKHKNAMLQDIMTHLEDEKMKFKKEVAQVVDKVLMPAVNRLENGDGTLSKTHRDVLRDGLEDLASESGGILYSYGKLTPREVEIVNMLKSGANSKDIAETLRISVLTVNKHRERIRRKLVITKKSVNLATFLSESQQ